MSGTTASRYIGGVPYGPGVSVGRYPNAASVGAMPGVVSGPTVQVRPVDYSGGIVPQSVGAATGGGAAVEGTNILASLIPLLGMLQYAPDAINAIDQLLNGAEQTDELPTPPEYLTEEQAAQLGAPDWFPAGAVPVPGIPPEVQIPQEMFHADPAALDSLGDFGGGAEGASGAAGGVAVPPSWGGAIEAAGGFENAVAAGTLPTDFGMTGALGELPMLGDIATGGLDLLGGAAGGWIAAQPFQNSNRPYAQTGQQIGSLAGGIIGQILIPIPGLGAAAGAAIGGLIGGQGGGLIGPEATIGRNFSSMGTLGGDGNIYWGPSGGDNGGTGQDASAFANWFASDLQRQAAAQGYALNPNMAGTQIRVGGYDNFSRDMQSPAGGYFYDVAPNGGEFAGTPQNYALRPSDDFAYNPYSREQAAAFSTNVLADLVARGVYTPGGATSYDSGYLPSTLGANYGWYGSPTGDYSQIEYGGGDFQNVLAGRQNAIQGYLNEQQRAAYEAAARANTAPGLTDQGYMPAAYDLSQPIFYNGNIVAPGGLGFPTQAAQQNPWAGIGVDAGLIDPGLAGVASNPGGA